MGHATEAGFELSEATVQIFEKKAKDAPSAVDGGETKLSDKPAITSSSENAASDAQPGLGEQMKPGKKNLKEGVKIG
jgi:hypothetical protein